MGVKPLLVATTFMLLSGIVRADDKSNQRSRKNLRQISLAFHNYHEAYGKLPGFANVDSNGKPLLSWRVHLLPFMGADAKALHREFRLHERWDSQHNKRLIHRMPSVYSVPLATPLADGHTCYLVPRSTTTLFPPNENGNAWQVKFSDIDQGLANIILTVEADRDAAVPWTKPADLPFDRTSPLRRLGKLRENGFLVSWASGQITLIPNSIAAGRPDRTEFLRGMFEQVGSRGLAYFLRLE